MPTTRSSRTSTRRRCKLHHRGHHATYVKKLNEAVAKHPELHHFTLSELLRDFAKVPAPIRTAVKDNGGGHLNHDLFWSVPRTRAGATAAGRPGRGDQPAIRFI